MKKSNLLLTSLIGLSMMLAGCGNERPASSVPGDSSNPISMSESLSSNEPSIESPSLPEASSESIPEISSSVPAESSSQEPPVESSSSEEEVISYTPAEAIDAVAGIISNLFQAQVAGNHDDDGDYLVLNFGEADPAQIKGYCGYFVPEGFEAAMEDWESDAFEDGTAVDYIDFICGNVVLEFMVFQIVNEENPDYSGTYLQIVAFDVSGIAE